MTTEQSINLLEIQNNKKNSGRGFSHIRTFIHFLRIGDRVSAEACFFNESDKNSDCKILEEMMALLLGLNKIVSSSGYETWERKLTK